MNSKAMSKLKEVTCWIPVKDGDDLPLKNIQDIFLQKKNWVTNIILESGNTVSKPMVKEVAIFYVDEIIKLTT